MKRHEFDPISYLEKSDQLREKAAKAINEDKNYDLGISYFKQSNRLLLKILTEFSDTRSTSVSKFRKLFNKKDIEFFLSLIFHCLGENYFNLFNFTAVHHSMEEARQYIKPAEKYLNLSIKEENNKKLYLAYLDVLIDSLKYVHEDNDFDNELIYLKKFLKHFFECLQLGYKLESVHYQNIIISLFQYPLLIENNEPELSEAINFIHTHFTLSEISVDELNKMNFFNFILDILENITRHFPNLFTEKEPIIFDILIDTLYELILNGTIKEMEDESYLQTILAILYSCTKNFNNLENIKELYQLNIDIIDVEGELGRTQYIIRALKSALSILNDNKELSSNFKELKLLNRLIGELGIAGELEEAQRYHRMIDTRLKDVTIDDVLKEESINSLNQAQNELLLLKAETYYFLASNATENGDFYEGLDLNDKCFDFLDEVSPNYESNLRTNLAGLSLSLNKFIDKKLKEDLLNSWLF